MLETLRLSWRLTLRHWDVYRQNLLPNIAPTVSDPVFFLLALGIGLGAYLHEMEGRTYLHFLAPGLAMATAFWTAFFESSYGFFIRHTYEGIYKAVLTTPIGPREVIIGEFIWVALKGAGMASGVTLVLLVAGVIEWVWLPLVPVTGALIALTCGSIGFIATAFVKNINQFQTVYALVINPVFFFSGIFFPIGGTPALIQVLVWCSPLYHGVRIGQAALWNEAVPATLLLHGPPLLAFTAILVPLAGRLIRPKLYQ